MLIVWIADEQINITSPFMVIGPGTEQKNLNICSKMMTGNSFNTFYFKFAQSHAQR
jgi:hypothetical protein